MLKQYDFIKLENDLLVPMDRPVVAVIPRKFPKEQTTQGSASGQTHDPASQGDEAETNKKN